MKHKTTKVYLTREITQEEKRAKLLVLLTSAVSMLVLLNMASKNTMGTPETLTFMPYVVAVALGFLPIFAYPWITHGLYDKSKPKAEFTFLKDRVNVRAQKGELITLRYEDIVSCVYESKPRKFRINYSYADVKYTNNGTFIKSEQRRNSSVSLNMKLKDVFQDEFEEKTKVRIQEY